MRTEQLSIHKCAIELATLATRILPDMNRAYRDSVGKDIRGAAKLIICNSKNSRYTDPNAETTAGGFGIPNTAAISRQVGAFRLFSCLGSPIYGWPSVGGRKTRLCRTGIPTRTLVTRPFGIGQVVKNHLRRNTMAPIAQSLTIGSSAIREIDGLYSLNDLHKASGGEQKNRPVEFVRLEQTKSLIDEIVKGGDSHLFLKSVTGRNGGTYACRELVIAYAAWISAAFHLQVIRVFLDTLPQQPTLPHYITNEQAGEISTLVAMRFPDGKDRPYAWSRFNNHFRLDSYKHLPGTRFDEAVGYVNQMPVRGHGLEDTLQRLTDQLSEKNSYPVALFEPLVKAYLEKTGGKLVKESEPSLRKRRWLVYFDHEGKEQVTVIPPSASLIDCDSKAALYTFLVEDVPLKLVPEAIRCLSTRVANHISWTNMKLGVAA